MNEGKNKSGARAINMLFWAEIATLVVSYITVYTVIISPDGALTNFIVSQPVLSGIIVQIPTLFTLFGVIRLRALFGYDFGKAIIFVAIGIVFSVAITALPETAILNTTLIRVLTLIGTMFTVLSRYYALNSMEALAKNLSQPILALQFLQCKNYTLLASGALAILSLFEQGVIYSIVSFCVTALYIYMLVLYRRLILVLKLTPTKPNDGDDHEPPAIEG